MLRGTMPSACAIAGTAVFRMVVSSDCMKNATATSHGKKRFTASMEIAEGTGATAASARELALAGDNLFSIAQKLMQLPCLFNARSFFGGALI